MGHTELSMNAGEAVANAVTVDGGQRTYYLETCDGSHQEEAVIGATAAVGHLIMSQHGLCSGEDTSEVTVSKYIVFFLF